MQQRFLDTPRERAGIQGSFVGMITMADIRNYSIKMSAYQEFRAWVLHSRLQGFINSWGAGKHSGGPAFRRRGWSD
jgi:hypothetical protein